MANPVIDSIVIVPATVPTKGTATVTINAHDPDARAFTITGTVTDSTGAKATGTQTGQVVDPLTFAAAVDVGILTPTSQPNVFTYTAP